MTNIGYIRVSSVDQKTDRQLDGVKLDEVFKEKASAGTMKRPVLEECMRFVRKGDILHVHSIDRLARNLGDLLSILKTLTGKGVALEFHKERLTFTGEDNPFQTLQLQIIGSVAQFERAIIRERQREGIAKAQAKGKHCGRKPTLTPEQVQEIRDKIAAGAEKKALATEYGVSRQTLYRILGG
ncbi:helix-turn-helix domain-containing protein [Pseudodesulfovibrio sp. F-1]|uniref:Helix-turn-helix domain-containing protein n=1 Tax=Pseudodesulfovibrio alkaliphilus TaxID=2661613 RepID=A0A7K1KQV4_9BACT|nr:recombinase family protein [Pseudodesulfovibrio alkaliphilus]MUM78292.1 helix-turn-helix domain-containing protein [Pseudodesulfovibrio alkaliphilus]